MRDFLRLNDRPLKIRFLIFFLPLIAASVASAGLFTWLFAESRLKANATRLLSETTSQTARFVSERFSTLFEELYTVEHDPSLGALILDRYPAVGPDRYLDIIALNNRVNALILRYPEVIDSIYIRLDNGYELGLMNLATPMQFGLDLPEWSKKYSWADKGYYWLNDHVDTVFKTAERRKVMSCFRMLGSSTSRVHGIVLFNLKSSYFASFLDAEGIGEHSYLALAGAGGFFTPRPPEERYRQEGEEAASVRSLAEAGRGGRVVRNRRDEALFLVNAPVQINQWQVMAVVPLGDLFGEAGRIRDFSILAVAVLALLSGVLATLFAGSLSSSIVYLSEQVRKVEGGAFDTEFAIEGKNEMGVLAKGLASLEATVRRLIAEVREEQETKRKAELSALQAQINPHFLCNTLTSIRHLVDMGETRAASSMVSSLEVFFMIGVSRGKDMIHVSEELEHAKSYLHIQQMRYSDDFAYEVSVDPAVLPCLIPKLTLQPLIENSIYHGIKNREGKGTIRLSGWREGDAAILEVYDDGPGIAADRLGRLLESIKARDVEESPITYGLRNVDERLRLSFGLGWGLAIESREGEWTRVSVRIPFGEGGLDG